LYEQLSRKFIKIEVINIGYEELMTTQLNLPEYKAQHGLYNQVPMNIKVKKYSVVRNPYDRILSLYRFQWWVSNPIIRKKILKEYCPSFTNLSIDEFAIYDQQLTNKFKKESKTRIDVKIGGQTIEFIEMFFKNPTTVLNKITNEYLMNDEYKKDLMSITFLKQEDLNIDLAKLLYKTGYNPSEINLAKNFKKINVTEKRSKETSLTKEVFKYTQTTEILLFRILKNQGITY
tara:strand:+ start:416 stop:1111 length:696 start_codon:yes stop_codon:yes gene_type:complete